MIAVVRVVVAAAIGAVAMLQLDRIAVDAAGGLQLVGTLPAWEPLPEAVRRSTDGLRLGAVGLAGATGVSAWLELALLRRQVRRRFGARTRVGGGVLGRQALALLPSAGLGAALAWWAGDLHPLLSAPLALLLMGATYVLAASALGVSEGRRLLSIARRALSRG